MEGKAVRLTRENRKTGTRYVFLKKLCVCQRGIPIVFPPENEGGNRNVRRQGGKVG